LHGVLLARIDRLEDEVRNTLQIASVIGKSFLYRILEAVAEAEVQLDEHLSQLQRIDLVREKARIPELEYMFKHALTQEAAYNSLLHERRKVFHLKVGEALEMLFPERVDDFLGLLAYHFDAAEAYDKAVKYLIEAGDKARLTYANQEGINYYRLAVNILKNQGKYDLAARTMMKLSLTYHNAFDFKNSHTALDQSFSLRERAIQPLPEEPTPAPHPFREFELWDIPTLDPIMAADSRSKRFCRNLFSGLIESGMDWEVVPDIAHRWELSDDGLLYTFHLRDDVFWSDGTQVKASDFVYACLQIFDPSIDSPRGKFGWGDEIKGARNYKNGEFTNPEQVGVQAIDDLTLKIELERPASYFIHRLSDFWPVPRHIIEKHGIEWTQPNKIVTNGPFMLGSYLPGESIFLVRSPNYHGHYSGNLQSIEVKLVNIVSDFYSECLNLYDANKIDLLGLAENIFQARQTYVEDYITERSNIVWCMSFDTSQLPFDDPRVRRAFSMAVDKEMLATEILDGYDDPGTGGLILPISPGHSPGIGLPYDPEQARRLLSEAGYPDGRGFPDIRFVWYQIFPTMEFLQEQWLSNLNVQIGIDIKRLEDVDDWYHERKLRLHGVGGSVDPSIEAMVKILSPEWKDARFEKLLEEAQQSLDQSERIRLYQEADELLIDEAAIMPFLYGRGHWLVKPWVKIPPGQIDSWNLKNYIIEPH
jgi:oligopeptide transport system substrate-binding protein